MKEIFKINKGTILIKITYFIFNLAVLIVWPFLTVQARKLGLTLSDISLVYSIFPAVTFFTSAVLGYLGDKIGFKAILVIDTIIIGAASTCFDLTPRYREESLFGSVEFYNYSNGDDPSSYVLKSIIWPSDACFQDFDVNDCENSKLLNDTDLFGNLGEYLDCSDLNDIEFETITIDIVNKTSNENGTLCIASQDIQWNETDVLTCKLNYPNITECVRTEGSHLVTFATYITMRIVYHIGLNSAFMIMDACTLVITRKFGSDYSNVMLWVQISNMLGPFIAGWLVEDNGDDTNYQLMYYASDGVLAISIILFLFFLKVEVQRTKENMIDSVKYFRNFTSIFFFIFCMTIGVNYAIHDTYMPVYFEEEYNVNSQFLGALQWIAGLAGAIIIPFAPVLMDIFGRINIIYISLLVECTRMVLWTLIGFAPEIGLGLAALDFLTWTLAWTSIMSYANDIAPPGLMATTASWVGIFTFLFGKGLGALIGGQLMDTSLGMTWTFRIFAGANSIIGTILITVYHIFGKNKEQNLIEERNASREELNINKEVNFGETKISDTQLQTRF